MHILDDKYKNIPNIEIIDEIVSKAMASINIETVPDNKGKSLYLRVLKDSGITYTGQARRTMEARSLSDGSGYKNGAMRAAIDKYGWEAFESISLFDRCLTPYVAGYLENTIINELNKAGLKIEGQKESRAYEIKESEKYSESHKGEKNGMYDKNHTAEACEKMSIANTGANNPAAKEIELWWNNNGQHIYIDTYGCAAELLDVYNIADNKSFNKKAEANISASKISYTAGSKSIYCRRPDGIEREPLEINNIELYEKFLKINNDIIEKNFSDHQTDTLIYRVDKDGNVEKFFGTKEISDNKTEQNCISKALNRNGKFAEGKYKGNMYYSDLNVPDEVLNVLHKNKENVMEEIQEQDSYSSLSSLINSANVKKSELCNERECIGKMSRDER